ncbi:MULTISPECIES: hypothetical protein [Staphylococcus]|uniref:hypothetical protein n=1 Tax=Staphylococcus TaxID=1279 RepID=UPI000BBC701B|nr:MULTISPECIES: hypothetical protein [Staphylococcus]MCQ9300562.1 hypothetical protein [Staphylococcus hyicus]PCF72857.1 hypothetical protein B4W71_08530 [Staphylococcus delphini]HAR6132482.1 hypothetical protein [Staphylococcus pseudintermedius]
MSEEQIHLGNPNNQKTIDLDGYKESKGLSIRDEEVKTMPEFIERKEFEQFEKRIDDNFKHLNSKIDSLPDRFADKMEIALNQQMEKMRKERKEDKKSIITWSLTGTSIIVGILTFLFNYIF